MELLCVYVIDFAKANQIEDDESHLRCSLKPKTTTKKWSWWRHGSNHTDSFSSTLNSYSLGVLQVPKKWDEDKEIHSWIKQSTHIVFVTQNGPVLCGETCSIRTTFELCTQFRIANDFHCIFIDWWNYKTINISLYIEQFLSVNYPLAVWIFGCCYLRIWWIQIQPRRSTYFIHICRARLLEPGVELVLLISRFRTKSNGQSFELIIEN